MEFFFKIATISIFVLLSSLRLVFKLKAKVYSRGLFSKEEGFWIVFMRILLGISLMGAFILYLVNPLRPPWVRLPLPLPLRMCGVFIGLWAIALLISSFMMTSNWVIGLTGLLIIGLLMTIRLKREEKMLLRHFGEEYAEYRGKTNKFFPKIGIGEKGRLLQTKRRVSRKGPTDNLGNSYLNKGREE